MALASGRGVVGNDPAVAFSLSSLMSYGEEPGVACRTLEAPDKLYSTRAALTPLLPRRQPVDSRGLRQQRTKGKVDDLLVAKIDPIWGQLIWIWRIPREE
eukprot:CAMPEP_0115182754 /NCGR_PEP_ID=MMETSP0270-20121206/8104_1 /TAXON_ID=71861 /ORGANISM="Scrippsiella trochoidea, Strain CCMP3099" /LENGTH=99 /DNA_ID=CAMNT_0002595807 /DNA_START=106 /DNA_END=405 /DNA_ORIENTATION=+